MRIIAERPPMGWNSWNVYLGAPDEATVRRSMRYMAARLLPFGYEYFTLDAGWYHTRDLRADVPSAVFSADRWGRPTPGEAAYPSAAGGRGFRPLADYAHRLGLKFGLHMMRGINERTFAPGRCVKGTETPLEELIDRESPCSWGAPGWYGIKTDHPDAQKWYDSLMENFAAWGVDFVKYDDLGSPLHAEEVLMIERAIERCGRDMALSLSPGNHTRVEDAEFYSAHATMWRISGDFWDTWKHLRRSFDLLAQWNAHIDAPGWPDADMLPLGWICESPSGRGLTPRLCRFTAEERRALFTLFCIARSPLILTCNLDRNDDELLALQTQPDCLAVNQRGEAPKALVAGPEDETHVWRSAADGKDYLAFFNLTENDRNYDFPLPQDLAGGCGIDVWTGRVYELDRDTLNVPIPAHGVVFLRIKTER